MYLVLGILTFSENLFRSSINLDGIKPLTNSGIGSLVNFGSILQQGYQVVTKCPKSYASKFTMLVEIFVCILYKSWHI